MGNFEEKYGNMTIKEFVQMQRDNNVQKDTSNVDNTGNNTAVYNENYDTDGRAGGKKEEVLDFGGFYEEIEKAVSQDRVYEETEESADHDKIYEGTEENIKQDKIYKKTEENIDQDKIYKETEENINQDRIYRNTEEVTEPGETYGNMEKATAGSQRLVRIARAGGWFQTICWLKIPVISIIYIVIMLARKNTPKYKKDFFWGYLLYKALVWMLSIVIIYVLYKIGIGFIDEILGYVT